MKAVWKANDNVRVVEKKNAYVVYVRVEIDDNNKRKSRKWQWIAKFRCLGDALAWVELNRYFSNTQRE